MTVGSFVKETTIKWQYPPRRAAQDAAYRGRDRMFCKQSRRAEIRDCVGTNRRFGRKRSVYGDPASTPRFLRV